MKVRITTSLVGTSYGREPDASGFAFRRGDITDVSPVDARDLVERGAAQLDLIGELQRPGYRPSPETLAELAAAIEPPASPLHDLRARIGRTARNAG